MVLLPRDEDNAPVTSALNPSGVMTPLHEDAQGNLEVTMTGSNVATQSGLSAGALNAFLVASTNIGAFPWWSLQITGTWVGTLAFQGSNDGINWNAIEAINYGSQSSITTSTTANGGFGGPRLYLYLQVQMVGYTSGVASATLQLYSVAPTALSIAALALQDGTWNVGLNAGTNVIGHAIIDSGNISSYLYEYDGSANNRRRSLLGLSPQSGTISAETSSAFTLSSATGLQPGQLILLTGGTADEWCETATSYTAGSVSVTLAASSLYTNHTAAAWVSNTAYGPQQSLFYPQGVGENAVVLQNGKQGIILQGDALGGVRIGRFESTLISNTYSADGDTGWLSVAQFSELAIDVDVTAWSGGTSPTFTLKVDRRAGDGVTGFPLNTIANAATIAANQQYSKTVGVGGSINESPGQQFRVRWSTAGGPTYSVYVSVQAFQGR